MPQFEGGNPIPVTVVTSGPQAQRAAVPVYVASGRAPIQGRARRVVVVTSGPVEGRAAVPVYDVGAGALYTDDPPIPVYVVSGSLGADPTLVYTNKVKALSPIAYWPFAEASGTTAEDESGNNRDGAYTSVTLGATGIGDGRTAATFTTGSVCNVFSASLAGAFSGVAGTVSMWAKVSAASVWTNGTQHAFIEFAADGSNFVRMRKTTTNNISQGTYNAGGTSEAVNITNSTTAWFHLAMTWDRNAGANGEVKAYLNGAQQGATQTSLGTFAGSLASATTVIGAANSGAAVPWSGQIAHTAIFTSALSAAQIAILATV